MTYPVSLKVDYPAKLSRLTTLFRIFMIIPQAIVLAFVSIAGVIIYILSWFAILFTGKYPQSFFDFVTWWFRWYVRVVGYFALLTDRYPPFTGEKSVVYPVALEVEQPGELSRITTFLRLPFAPTIGYALPSGWEFASSWWSGFPMAFPHQVVLSFINIAVAVVVFISWWAILFTGNYPRSLFDFVVWAFRWNTRVEGYIYLVTDKYPPFSGNE
jgi:hypothetical protein